MATCAFVHCARRVGGPGLSRTAFPGAELSSLVTPQTAGEAVEPSGPQGYQMNGRDGERNG